MSKDKIIPVRDNENLSSEEESSIEEDVEYGTPVRTRQRFTADETRMLEDYFNKENRPSAEVKKHLATEFNTVPGRIQIWFQNRRAKEKKITSQEKETPSEKNEEKPEGSHENKRLRYEERPEIPLGYFPPLRQIEHYAYRPNMYYIPQLSMDPRHIDPNILITPYERVPEGTLHSDIEEEVPVKKDVKGKKKAD